MPFVNGKWHAKMTIMVGKLTLDKAGRVVLPKPLRDEMRLEPGDVLEIESTGEEITLRPLRGQAQLRKKQGVWVFRSGEPLSASETEKVVRRVRQERESEVLDQDR
jgi:AbrB family looped-hinge helix DNA binding protein